MVTDAASEPNPPTASPVTKKRLLRDLAYYTGARLLMVIVIAAIIVGVGALFGVQVPILVALIFALLITLPLSLLLFKSLRIRVNASIAGVDEQRRRDRDDLQAKLRGEDRR